MSARLDSVAKVSGVTASSKEFEDIKKEYCGQTKDGFPDLSSIKLNFSVLSPLCKKNIEESFDHYIESTQYKELVDQNDGLSLINMSRSTAHMSALFCSGMKRIELQNSNLNFWPFITLEKAQKEMKEVETQAMKYFDELIKDYENNKSLNQ